jgi:hypothetical protein
LHELDTTLKIFIYQKHPSKHDSFRSWQCIESWAFESRDDCIVHLTIKKLEYEANRLKNIRFNLIKP